MPITISNNTITGVQAGGMDGVPFASGTKLLFQQSSAPTGWTKDVTHNDKSMRVVSGTVGSGGSVAFTTAFASRAVSGSISSTTATNQAMWVSGTVNNTTLTEWQIPSHTHAPTSGINGDRIGQGGGGAGGWSLAGGSSNNNIYRMGSSSTGGSGAHNHSFSGDWHGHTQDAHSHSFTGTAINMAVQYVDVIIATKD